MPWLHGNLVNMSSRVGGAVLALTAAALLAGSSVPIGDLIGARGLSSWWSGFPTIGEHEYTTKEVHIGLFKASGCDIQAEEAKCQRLEIGGAFVPIKWAEGIAV